MFVVTMHTHFDQVLDLSNMMSGLRAPALAPRLLLLSVHDEPTAVPAAIAG